MSLPKIIRREIEVAFSKHAQPVWFRVMKYVILAECICLFWDKRLFWIILAVVFALSICLHLWYRYKTNGWTRSYGGWDYEKNKPRNER